MPSAEGGATSIRRASDARRLTPDAFVVEIAGLGCAYDGGPVLRGVDLRVPAGQFVGLIGPSGAGKTTLLRALLGAVPRVEGTVRVNGRPVRPGRPPAGLGYVPQVETVDWHFPVTVEDV